MEEMRLAKVAVVGRPNVGKSALFNRLIGRRLAIVDSVFGVTRDRIQGVCSRVVPPFSIFDMGGYVSGRTEGIEASVNKQILSAIEEADIILFVVDSIDGSLPEDEMIAVLLRRSGKPIVLTANKADNGRLEERAMDFLLLGLGEPVAVSAAHGINIEGLAEEIAERIPPEFHVKAGPPELKPVSFCLVGRRNVGKSTLTNAILGEERCVVSDTPGTTRDSIDAEFSRAGKRYIIIDTAGMQKRRNQLRDIDFYSDRRAVEAVSRADIAALLLEGPTSILDADKKIAALAKSKGKGLIIAVNKMDLMEKPVRERIVEQLADAAPFLRHTPVVFISALKREGLGRLLDEISRLNARMKLEIPSEELQSEIFNFISLFPARGKGRAPVVHSVRQTRANPPRITLTVNSPDSFAESWLRQLENHIIEVWELFGTPLELSLEKKAKKKTGGKK